MTIPKSYTLTGMMVQLEREIVKAIKSEDIISNYDNEEERCYRVRSIRIDVKKPKYFHRELFSQHIFKNNTPTTIRNKS